MGLRRAFEECMSVNPQQAPQVERWRTLSKTEVKDHVGRRNYISNACMNMERDCGTRVVKMHESDNFDKQPTPKKIAPHSQFD